MNNTQKNRVIVLAIVEYATSKTSTTLNAPPSSRKHNTRTGLQRTTQSTPTLEKDPHTFWRIRYDKVDKGGKITIRYAGELRKLYIGWNYRERRVSTLIHANNTITIERETGTIIAEHTIDKTKKISTQKRNDDARHTSTK